MDHALTVLEYDKVLAMLSDHAETALGEGHCRSLRPAFTAEKVKLRLDETRQAYDLLATAAVPSMTGIKDLRQSLNLASKGSMLPGEECARIADCFACLGQLRDFLADADGPLGNLGRQIGDFSKVEQRIRKTVDKGGTVLDSASPTLASIRSRKQSTAARIVERIQGYVSGRQREYLSDPLYTIRDGRYVLPVKSEYRGRIRGIVHDTSASGATVYVEPEDVLQLGNGLRELDSAEKAEVNKVLLSLSQGIGAVAMEASGAIQVSGILDGLFARGRLAFAWRGVEPQLTDRGRAGSMRVLGARHPLLNPETVVPLDLEVGVGANILITGPNTGGKTVAMKSFGLCAALGQSGLFPPAREVVLSPFSAIFADIGDEQSLQQSLSTFSGHVKNLSIALAEAPSGALVLFDEIGAGTDPEEGAALAVSLLHAFAEKGCAILASTHFGELKAFALEAPEFANAAMEFDLKSLRPTYRLIMGAVGASQALRIAERYGVPTAVVEEAKSRLGQTSAELTQLMQKLDTAQKQARIAQSEADRRLTEARQLEEKANKALREAEETRQTVRSRSAAELEDLLRKVRLEASALFEQFKGSHNISQRQIRDGLDRLQGEARAKLGGATSKPLYVAPAQPIEAGMMVRVQGMNQIGLVLEAPSKGPAKVQLGSLKMAIDVQRLSRVEDERRPRPAKQTFLKEAQTASTEIHLRMMRAEDAEQRLDRFLDDALLAGVPTVRIVHGKGSGVLRNLTRELLRKNPQVESFRDGDAGEGGQGVTVVTFK